METFTHYDIRIKTDLFCTNTPLVYEGGLLRRVARGGVSGMFPSPFRSERSQVFKIVFLDI